MFRVVQILPLPAKSSEVSAPASRSDRLKVDAMFSISSLKELITASIVDQIPLIEACLIATSLHVLFLPVVWCMGWMLPWPKSPVVTSVIEIDLRDWPKVARPKKLYEFRDPKLNE